MVCFVHQRIGVQSRVCHDSVDEVVHHGGDAVDAAKSVVERELFCLGMINLLMRNFRIDLETAGILHPLALSLIPTCSWCGLIRMGDAHVDSTKPSSQIYA
jgi:hypothetical protein